jgi:hypothetical protein
MIVSFSGDTLAYSQADLNDCTGASPSGKMNYRDCLNRPTRMATHGMAREAALWTRCKPYLLMAN